jgi:hypothetical protein
MIDIRANRETISAAVAVALVLGVAPAHASLIILSGADDGAGSLATAPNSVAAAESFDAAVAALGIEHTITFESSPLGAFSSLALASGITLTGANINNNPQSIVNTTPLREDRSFCCYSVEPLHSPSMGVQMRSVPT